MLIYLLWLSHRSEARSDLKRPSSSEGPYWAQVKRPNLGQNIPDLRTASFGADSNK